MEVTICAEVNPANKKAKKNKNFGFIMGHVLQNFRTYLIVGNYNNSDLKNTTWTGGFLRRVIRYMV